MLNAKKTKISIILLLVAASLLASCQKSTRSSENTESSEASQDDFSFSSKSYEEESEIEVRDSLKYLDEIDHGCDCDY